MTRPIAKTNRSTRSCRPIPQKPYDMSQVIERVVDEGSWLEVQEGWARNILVGFARLGGRVGRHRREPAVGARGLPRHRPRARKAALHSILRCVQYSVVTFEDVPGFLPGTAQEHMGIIRRGAKLLYAYCEATVPLLTVITRKAYGGAYDVMASKHVGADVNVAWPGAMVAVMGAAGAARSAPPRDPGLERPRRDREATCRRIRRDVQQPLPSAARGFVDDVIEASKTRPYLIRSLELLATKRENRPVRKHGNIPL